MDYNPWRDARDNFPDYTINIRHELPAGVGGFIKGKTIYLCRTLDEDGRRCTLPHELDHIRNGTDHLFEHPNSKEERAIDIAVARRLITVDKFVDALAWSRRTAGRECAAELRVDSHTLKVWVQSLSAHEKREIQQMLKSRGVP
ncbi:hypothetical protein [Rhodococcus sp. NPDC060176]|uniref:hypothetical protein n=1 Tax=Rhodococcus sp. NPDC060176 TaxID=3347062 RepID=UPI0036520860